MKNAKRYRNGVPDINHCFTLHHLL